MGLRMLTWLRQKAKYYVLIIAGGVAIFSSALSAGQCDCDANLGLNQPNMSASAVIAFAAEAAVSAFTYDYVNYHIQLQQASNYFTPNGWKSFNNALMSSGNLQNVISKKLVASAVPTNVPVILEQGLKNNIYTWKVQVPLLTVYQSASTMIRQPLITTMIITRTSKYIGQCGIGISQFFATNILNDKQANTP